MPPHGYSPSASVDGMPADAREHIEHSRRSEVSLGPYNIGSSERRYSYRTGSERPRLNSFNEDRRHFRRSRQYSFDDHESRRNYSPSRSRNLRGFRQEPLEESHIATSVSAPESAVFIRGLPATVRESALKEWFEERLNLSSDCICLVRIDRAPLTTGTVGFNDASIADRAVESCNRQSFMGTELRLVRQKLQKGISPSEKRSEDEREKLERQRELDQMLRGRRIVIANKDEDQGEERKSELTS